MPAFLIARVTVTDPVAYETYKALAQQAVAKHGGKYVARGGQTETLEGDEETNRVVILEFDDMAAARSFYNSDEYSAARTARKDAAHGQFVVVEGL